MLFLANPCKIWENGGLEYKRMVLRLVFADNLAYTRGIGYRTPKTTIPFKVLEGFSGLKSKMVPPHGTTPRRKTHIKQLLTPVKFDFVAHVVSIIVTHQNK